MEQADSVREVGILSFDELYQLLGSKEAELSSAKHRMAELEKALSEALKQ